MDIDYNIISSVRKIVRAVDVFSNKLKDKFGLTSSQITCLEFLEENGASPITSIAKTLQLSPSMLTNIIDQLEQKEFIARIRSTKDRRVILIKLTSQGLDIMKNIPDSLNKKLLRNLGNLKYQEKNSISDSLSKIISYIEAEELSSMPLITTGAQLAGEEEANLTLKGNFKSKKPS